MAIVLLVLLTAANAPPSAPTGSPGTSTVTPAAHTNASFPTPIRHVFTIVLENAGLSGVLNNGAYLKTLYNTYTGASNYYGVCHPSAPNYLAMTSGRLFQCGSDDVSSYSATNIADLVTASGETWAAYMESMPSPCYGNWYDSLYKPGHDPFIYYQDLTNSGACASQVLPLSDFDPAVTPANYVFITPNLLDDGHNTSVRYASAWLQSYLPTLLAEPWASSTVFFVVYDEGMPSDKSGYDGLHGGHTYLAAVSPYTLGHGLYTADASPYSLLSTIEWLLGTGSTGANDSEPQFAPMKSMFSFNETSPPPTYNVSGSVRASNQSAIAGATVYANSSTNSTEQSSGPNGTFAFALPNGTYALTATATGFQGAETNVTVAGGPVSGLNLTLTALNTTPPPPTLYPVAFTERGLPPGTTWSVGVDGSNLSSTNATVTTELGNGSAAFVVSGPEGYLATPTNGTVEVQGSGINVTISFSRAVVPPPENYSVSFVPEGLAANGTWGVELGSNSTQSMGTVVFAVPNGTYPYSVRAPANFSATPSSGDALVDGANVSISVNLSAVPRNVSATFPVVFSQNGLTPGTAWWVAVVTPDGTENVSSDGPTITLNLTNGTYEYAVGSQSGYSPAVSQGTLVFPGADRNLTVRFSFPETVGPTPNRFATSSPTALTISGTLMAILTGIAIGVAVTFDIVLQSIGRRVGRAPKSAAGLRKGPRRPPE